MARETAQFSEVHPLRSLFIACTLVVACCVVVVAFTIETKSYLNEERYVKQSVAERAAEVTNLLSMQLGGSVQFENNEALDRIVGNVMAQAGQDALGAVVYDAQANKLYQTPLKGKDAAVIDQIALQVLESGANVLSESGNAKGVPITFGENNQVVGVVVTEWTEQFRLEGMFARRLQSLAAGAGVLALALVAAALFLRWHMSQPLTRLQSALSTIARGDYGGTVTETHRPDEIGTMAIGLEHVRIALAQSQDLARETDFKSTAFVSSSAPMMMVNEDFEVIFVNPACEALIGKIMTSLVEVWPAISPKIWSDATCPILMGSRTVSPQSKDLTREIRWGGGRSKRI
ncbi:HAMP domain-containing protein [Sulfitobacter aestuariivivens]|uniref:HAMP domain-containing protein n=1 Tax=Sulfitobacter aestuariivivens TaxID=2766981 RepID=UPI003610500C